MAKKCSLENIEKVFFIYEVHEEVALLRVTYFHYTPNGCPKMISILSKLYRDIAAHMTSYIKMSIRPIIIDVQFT